LKKLGNGGAEGGQTITVPGDAKSEHFIAFDILVDSGVGKGAVNREQRAETDWLEA